MRALLIDPTTRTITEVDYDGHYKSITRLIQCEPSPFTILRIDDSHVIYLDDEGLLKPHIRDFFFWSTYPSPLAGRGLIVNTSEEGDDLPCELELKQVQDAIRWARGRVDGMTQIEGKTKMFGKDAAFVRFEPNFVELPDNQE